MDIREYRRTLAIWLALVVAFAAFIGAAIDWMELAKPRINTVERPATSTRISPDVPLPVPVRKPQASRHPDPAASVPGRGCREPDVSKRDPECLFGDSENRVSEDNAYAQSPASPQKDANGSAPENGPSSLAAAQAQELAAVRAVSVRLDALVAGSVGISAPSEVLEYDSFPLILRISAGNAETIIQGLRHDFPENETIVGGSVKLATHMTAHVQGPDLEVSPAGEVSQAISLNEPTTWRWQAKANRNGIITITFTVVATPLIEGTAYPRNYYFERAVRVKVAPAGFLMRYWQWFASSIFIPLAIAGWAWFKRRQIAAKDASKKARRRRPMG
jgi:hypothetical protein